MSEQEQEHNWEPEGEDELSQITAIPITVENIPLIHKMVAEIMGETPLGAVVVGEEKTAMSKLPEYGVKVSLVLEGSNQFDWGVVKDTHGTINFIPEDAEVCGTWHVYNEGVFWVYLTSPIEARLDRAIMLFKEMTERRLREPGTFPPSARKTRGAPKQPRQPRQPKPKQEQLVVESPSNTLLTQMRAKIMEGRKSEES